jgi:hypothetical protein
MDKLLERSIQAQQDEKKLEEDRMANLAAQE